MPNTTFECVSNIATHLKRDRLTPRPNIQTQIKQVFCAVKSSEECEDLYIGVGV